MDPDIEDIIAAAKAGGQVVMQYFGQVLSTEQKSTAGDLRTAADTESEQTIIIALELAFPTYNIYAEESGTVERGSDYTFVIDPLDGTNNFVLGIPDFSISIGLLHGDEAIAGVVYVPATKQVFWAQKGKGAFQNGLPVHVNGEQTIHQATVSYTCGYQTSREYSEALIRKLRDTGTKRILDTWAPAYDYCLLASGRIEAVISKEGDLEDYVAAKVIVREAGGIIQDFNGHPAADKSPDFIATTTSKAASELLKLDLSDPKVQ